VKSVHVERQVVQLAMKIGNRRVGVPVEGNYGIDKVPHRFVGGVENMRTVFVDMNTFNGLTIDIPAQVMALVNHQTPLSFLLGLVGKHGTKESCTNNEVMIGSHFL
jgi:hypothetical protein